MTEDCQFDFTPAGKKLGIRFSLVSGRDAILQSVLSLIGPLDTSHSATNLQIEISGDTASLYCYVQSQHFMPREGCRPDTEYALLMNRYDCELVRDGAKWRFKRITIDNAWALGNVDILNALAERQACGGRKRNRASIFSAKRDGVRGGSFCLRLNLTALSSKFPNTLRFIPMVRSDGVSDRQSGDSLHSSPS